MLIVPEKEPFRLGQITYIIYILSTSPDLYFFLHSNWYTVGEDGFEWEWKKNVGEHFVKLLFYFAFR